MSECLRRLLAADPDKLSRVVVAILQKQISVVPAEAAAIADGEPGALPARGRGRGRGRGRAAGAVVPAPGAAAQGAIVAVGIDDPRLEEQAQYSAKLGRWWTDCCNVLQDVRHCPIYPHICSGMF